MEMDTTAIVQECQRGNLENFTLLFDEYNRKIYNFIYYRTHHKQTAEDLTADVFFKALDKIKQFDPRKGVFSTWLYQIARNSIVDYYRGHKETADIEDAWDIADTVDIARDVDAVAKLARVQDFLKTLPRQQRDIIIMRVWEGLSHKEIAEILGISEANSKINFSRALAKVNKQVMVAILAIIILQAQ